MEKIISKLKGKPMLLADLKAKSDKAFETLVIPEPAILWKDKLDALKTQNLQQQYERCLMDMRIEQVKMMGFQPITVDESVEILMGEKHTHRIETKDRHVYEWVYNHHNDQIITGRDCSWGSLATDYFLAKKIKPWYLPPFCTKEIWRCRFGKIDYLERDIPYGVILRINELKELKIFNCFSIVAPIEAWQHKTDIDPIVLGFIWEMPVTGNEYSKAGDTQAFFIAQW